jgi:Family of unknown function (DUF6328)
VADPQQAKQEVEREQQREELKERLEREHTELLHELRALIPGAQVLFGFLLAIRFTTNFDDLSEGQRWVYYATLVFTSAALVLYMAPAAHHRIRFRAGDKEFTMQKANREAIAGSVAAGLSFTGAFFLLTDLVSRSSCSSRGAGGRWRLCASSRTDVTRTKPPRAAASRTTATEALPRSARFRSARSKLHSEIQIPAHNTARSGAGVEPTEPWVTRPHWF